MIWPLPLRRVFIIRFVFQPFPLSFMSKASFHPYPLNPVATKRTLPPRKFRGQVYCVASFPVANQPQHSRKDGSISPLVACLACLAGTGLGLVFIIIACAVN